MKAFNAYNEDFIDVDIHIKEELIGMKNTSPEIVGRTTDNVQEENQPLQTSLARTCQREWEGKIHRQRL